MMSYEQFKQELLTELRESFPEGTQISIQPFPRNNNIVLDGLTILEPGSNISPNIYLNHYFKSYQEGDSFQSILGSILRYYCGHCCKDGIDTSFFTNFEKTRSRIAYKLVHYERNRELLADVPHFRYLDLAIVFFCLFPETPYQNASALIHSSHLDLWNTSADSLLALARQNTPSLLPFCCSSLADLLMATLGDSSKDGWDGFPSDCLNDPVPMYVLSNQQRINGAGCILYEGALKGVAQELGDDLYLLPSSIHEVIAIPASQAKSPSLLALLVREINATEVSPDEILSDNVYHYDRKSGLVAICQGKL